MGLRIEKWSIREPTRRLALCARNVLTHICGKYAAGGKHAGEVNPASVSLEIDFHVAVRPGAANEDIAFRRRIERFGFVLDRAAH